MLINLFLELSEGLFDSTDRREIKFCVYLSYFHDFRSQEMLIHAHSLSFYCFFILGSHWGRSWVRGPIGDPRVGVPIGVAPGQGLGGPWPLGPPKASWALGTRASGPPLGHPPRPLGLGSHWGVPGSGGGRAYTRPFPKGAQACLHKALAQGSLANSFNKR